MAGVAQLINPGGAFGYSTALQNSRFYLFGEFQLDSTALRGCYPGTPVAFGVPGTGTARTILPAGEAAVAGYNSLYAAVIGAALDWIVPPSAAANTSPADFGPNFVGVNAGIGNVLVGGYLTGAPVLGDGTSTAATTQGLSYQTGPLLAVANGATGQTITAPSVVSGCWYPWTFTPGSATWAGVGVLPFYSFPTNTIYSVGGAGKNATITAASGAGVGAGFNSWTVSGGTAPTAPDVGSAIFIPTAGNAAGSIGLSTVITSIVSTTVFTTADPNLKTGGSGAQASTRIGAQVDLWFPLANA